MMKLMEQVTQLKMTRPYSPSLDMTEIPIKNKKVNAYVNLIDLLAVLP